MSTLITFYVESNEPKQGWRSYSINATASTTQQTKSSHHLKDQVIQLVRLSDGRVLMTNQLQKCKTMDAIVLLPPKESLTGMILATKCQHLQSREALQQFLDDWTRMERKTTLTHFKVSGQAIQVLDITHVALLDLVADYDDSTSFFIFYHEDESKSTGFDILHENDLVIDLVNLDAPAARLGASLAQSPPAYDMSWKYEYRNQDYEEEFTPFSGYYRTGNGEQVFAMAGESPDYTACDKECGYCGRCPY